MKNNALDFLKKKKFCRTRTANETGYLMDRTAKASAAVCSLQQSTGTSTEPNSNRHVSATLPSFNISNINITGSA